MDVLVIEDVSLREQTARGGDAARCADRLIEAYYPLLSKVFPLDGEIEQLATYVQYLRDPCLEWDIVVLTDARSGSVIGGIHWQPLRNLSTSWVDALAWVEHVWLIDDPEVRRHTSFRHLLATVRKHMRLRGIAAGFMEFNDPEKMTPEEMEQDAAGGLSPRDRFVLWAGVGLSELTYTAADGRPRPAPYAQPAMDGGPPVRMLSLGFFALGQSLDGGLSAADYLRILGRAHATIRGVDPASDPTCREYTAAVHALGVAGFAFVPLKQRLSAVARPASGGSRRRSGPSPAGGG